MSSELYEVLSLAARYLFTLLGVLIVLRSFLWLLSEGSQTRRRLRHLPDAGTVGEMLVLQGGPGLEEGAAIPVPWEGVLGSVRSSDITVPCEGVRPSHLFFSYQVGLGLLIRPMSGCEATVDSVVLDCRADAKAHPMVHGSFLQVGGALLRLRVFAGLESNAGFADFPDDAGAARMPGQGGYIPGPDGCVPGPDGYGPVPGPDGYIPRPDGYIPVPGPDGYGPVPGPDGCVSVPDGYGPGPGPDGCVSVPDGYSPGPGPDDCGPHPDDCMPVPDPGFNPAAAPEEAPQGGAGQKQPEAARRRRSSRWEADWSE